MLVGKRCFIRDILLANKSANQGLTCTAGGHHRANTLNSSRRDHFIGLRVRHCSRCDDRSTPQNSKSAVGEVQPGEWIGGYSSRKSSASACRRGPLVSRRPDE